MFGKYVNNVDVFKHRLPREIVIYGTGHDASRFYQGFRDYFDIKCFLDINIPVGKIGMVDGIEVHNAARELRKGLRELILVIDKKEENNICKILDAHGLVPVNDFVIWTWDSDNVNLLYIDNFIEWNKRVWMNNRGRKENKILATMYGVHSGMAVFDSYYANIFAEKYDAEIVGCLIKEKKNNFLVKEVYKSFNTKAFLEKELSKEQQLKVEALFGNIYPRIKSKYDLLNLSIEGIDFGFEMYRTFIRSFTVIGDFNDYVVEFKQMLYEHLEIIVYYLDYFKTHKVKVLLLTDGLYKEGLVRLIGWQYGAKVFSLDEGRIIPFFNGNYAGAAGNKKNYKEIFEQLPKEQQKDGVQWAKERLDGRLHGDVSDIPYMAGKTAFTRESDRRILSDSKKLKVMICPHCTTDDPYPFGKFIFADHEDWLCYLGELSQKTNYDWYIKYHPSAGLESIELWDDILRRYPQIKKLPDRVSPQQLKKEGMKFALTLWGTIGHEYPALGIQVINGARNYHEDFDFDWNPKTFEEYEELLLNLDKVDKKIDMEEIYKFYYIHYRFMVDMDGGDIFYPYHQIFTPNMPCPLSLNINGVLTGFHEQYGEWLYHWFLADCRDGYHEKLVKMVKKRIELADR